MTSDTEAKLSYLRQDAADALRVYMGMSLVPHPSAPGREQINVAALGFLDAQAKYTLACFEAKQDDILPYVEVPNDHQ